MDRTVLARRRALAQQRVVAAAGYLAERHGLPDEYAAVAAASSGTRDPEVRAMLELEALADFLEAMTRRGIVTTAEAARGVAADSWEALELAPRARAALIAAGYADPAEAASASDEELLALDGVGRGTVAAIRAAAGAPAAEDGA